MRSVEARVRQLEKVVEARPPAPCGSCGAPKGWVAGFVVQDTDGRSLHSEFCPKCGLETMGGRAMSPIPGGYREVLILPRASPPLPV